MIYLKLFISFLKVGLFSFGGAYSAIPLIRDEVISNGWLTDEMLTNIIAISESTPGPIMVNLATYIGSTQAGFLGSLIATFAVILPAFLIILLIMVLLKKLIKNKVFQAVLDGLKPCIIGIIFAIGIYFVYQNCFGKIDSFSFSLPSLLITIGLAIIYFGSKKFMKKGISPILLIAISAVVGIIVFGII
ncbi:MAG: chromate transporter [bacterium]|nr:chromate transporter [bacterium]